MKGIHLIFIFSIISQTFLFSQVVVKRNNQVSKEQANVNWSKEYTLFDYTTDEPIFPLIRNGQPVYKIYYASIEDPRPNYGEFSIVQVEGLKYYKFKNRETCFKFCLANKLNAVPTLTTSSISGITTTSATSGGNITADGGTSITARGVVWSTSTNPTIALTIKTSNGTGTGSFSSSLSNLSPKTTYYVRAYATNSTGTGYGNEISFTTSDSTNAMGTPCPGAPTVKDIDGNTYNTVQIGTQCWTKENLRVTKYRDGTFIPLDESGGIYGDGIGQIWSTRTIGARTVYGHNATNLAIYGYLYNWYAVADSKGLCPSGWHVPSESDWKSLGEYLGTNAGVKLADTSWLLATGKPTNESGFSVIPGGIRDTTGRFSSLLGWGNFWSTSYSNNYTVNPCIGTELYIKGNWNLWNYNTKSGLSVRCLKLPDSIVSLPIVITTQVTSISANSVVSGGTIYSDRGSSVTSRGVVWAINPAPTIALSTKTTDYLGTGTFSSSIINLKPNTTYYLRAYATNKIGTTYGNELIFNTQDTLMNIPCPGYSTVKDIDGNIYNTVKIGSQCWTKENLRVTKYRDGTAIPLDDSGGTTGNGIGQTWNSRITGARTIYEHNVGNLATYGYLYNWYAAADTKGLCPSGWNVPNDNDFSNLTAFLGGVQIAGALMKTIGTTFWKIPNSPATNESGFSALPGGHRNNVFTNIGFSVGFWSTTNDIYDYSARVISLNSNRASLLSFGTSKSTGFSIRCLKDTSPIVSIPTLTTTAITAITTTSATSGGNITSEGEAPITARGIVWSTSTNPTITLSTKTSNGTGTGSFSSSLTNLTPKTTYYVRAYATNSAGTGYGNEITFTTSDSTIVMGIPCPGTPTVKDIDGNTYNTVQIGTQCWTKENLRVTKYRDGSVISLDESGGISGKEGVVTWTRNTGARTVYANSSANFDTYGYLYNWYAVADKKGICPIGWHVPSDGEWSLLTSFLGGDTVAGGKMKTIGMINWQSPNTGATNESGFSALPGGFRLNDIFVNIKLNAYFWTTTENNNTFAWYRGLDYYYGKGVDRRDNLGKPFGVSIRCLKDTFSIVSIPTLTTTAIASITTTSATSGGNITAEGGASITARGIVWSTSTNPTIALTTKTSNGTGTGSFTSSLNNLTPKTTYYVRAYATNSSGTGYGNEITFTTSDSTNVMGIPCPGTPTVKDIDGNTYNTVQIGTQCWTKENLRVTKYRDGSIIPLDESGGTNGDGTGQTWSSRTTGARTVYGHSAANLATYGYLYNWYTVGDTKGLCPSGWHVPSEAEWNSLSSYLGNDPGVKLADTSWILAFGKPTNESGFSVKPGGYRDTSGRFSAPLISGNFWSTTKKSSSNIFKGRGLYSKEYWDTYSYYGASGLSVRCLKDSNTIVSKPILTTTAITGITNTSSTSGGNITSDGGASITARGVVWSTSTNPTITLTTKTSNGTGAGSFSSNLTNLTPKTTYYVRAYATNSAGTGYGNEITFTTAEAVMNIPCPGTPTVKDIDGNVYNTVQIGTQCWTKENLRITKYRDGTVIPLDESGGTNGGGTGQTWGNRNTGARTVYAHSAANLVTYGYLYNWYAATDTKGLCPSGWHLPLDGEWTILIKFLDNNANNGIESTIQSFTAGGALKELGTTFWEDPNMGATNESGFSALPSGNRYSDGEFGRIGNIKSYCFFWSATVSTNLFYALGRGLSSTNSYIGMNANVKSVGSSVRCLKDTFSIVSIPTLTTNAITALSTTSGTSGGNITSNGGCEITSRGVVWSTNPNPTISLNTKTSDVTSFGVFTSNLTGLNANTTYYIRAYATNCSGTGYGNELSFKTIAITQSNSTPTVTTAAMSEVNQNTAIGGGNVKDDGGANVTSRGVVWSLSPNPTVTLNTKTIAGTGTGNFTSLITGLSPNTTYYLRAYATNNVGTGYGEEISFIGPSLSMSLSDTTVVQGAAFCLNFKVSNFNNILAMDIEFYYNPQKLTYNKVQGFLPDFPGLYVERFGNMIETGNKSARLHFNWLDPTVGGVSLPTSSTLFQVCFTAGNAIVQDTLKINILDIIDGDEKPVRVVVNSPIIIIKTVACPPSISDVDGNTYNTVQIGTQCWTKENLRVTKYRDGSVIPSDESGGTTGDGTGQTWGNRNTGARTVYGHNAANLATYGYLYNWHAVADSKGLCPIDWHVPTDAEWTNLTNYLGGESIAGGKLKTTGITNWNSPNTVTNNESGFSALPGGYRDDNGSFGSIRGRALFWSDSWSDIIGAWGRILYNNDGSMGRFSSGIKQNGYSLRCLRD